MTDVGNSYMRVQNQLGLKGTVSDGQLKVIDRTLKM